MAARRRLLQAGAGSAALFFLSGLLAQGRIGRGVHRASGEASVNGVAARVGTEPRPGDTVRTGADGELLFVLGRDAFLVRRDSEVALLADGFRAVTGAVLSVFAPGARRRIRTETAVIGIRGTAVYIEAEPSRTYVCTCYGEAVLEPLADPAARETVRTRYHEQPRYIMAGGAPAMVMEAPVINHTDAELALLEGLVGRQPPFLEQGIKPAY